MAREYGYRPTEIMETESMAAIDRFHMDFDIHAATSMFIEDKREEARDVNDPRSARVGSTQEQNSMIQEQTERADQRDAMEQAGMNAPSPTGQMQQLDDVLDERSGTGPDADQQVNDGR